MNSEPNQIAPAPVTIVDTVAPVPVVITDAVHAAPQTVSRAEGLVASPTTTAEQDLVTQGQRRINLIWEATQAVIAITVTGANIYAALAGKESILLGNAFTLIIAIYFVRQNHIKVGGVGGTDSRSR